MRSTVASRHKTRSRRLAMTASGFRPNRCRLTACRVVVGFRFAPTASEATVNEGAELFERFGPDTNGQQEFGTNSNKECPHVQAGSSYRISVGTCDCSFC